MIVLIGCIIIWFLNACAEGMRDGFLYHYRSSATPKDNFNIHWLFSLQRTILFLALTTASQYGAPTLQVIITMLGLFIGFSWFHNGSYYTTRHFLNKKIYPKKWADSSTSSEALVELDFKTRTILFIFAIGIILFGFTIG